MVGSKDLQPSTAPFFPNVFFYNQFLAKPQWPVPDTDLSDQTAIITGSNTGLGYESGKQLLGLKLSRLILAVRSIEKGEAAATQLRESYPQANIEVWHLDMSSYSSIQSFASRVETRLKRVDIVILNAGLRRLTYNAIESTGHEEIIQINYLSTVLLTILLLPILKSKRLPSSQPPRLTIINAALSLATTFPKRDAIPLLSAFDDPKSFDGHEYYNTSKLLMHMFLWKLVEYVSSEDVIVNLADPAWVRGTGITRDLTGPKRIGLSIFGLLGRTVDVGASCYVDAVVSKGEESHGCFLMSWQIHPFAPFLYTPEGKVVIERLWTETMTELKFAGVSSILDSIKAI